MSEHKIKHKIKLNFIKKEFERPNVDDVPNVIENGLYSSSVNHNPALKGNVDFDSETHIKYPLFYLTNIRYLEKEDVSKKVDVMNYFLPQSQPNALNEISTAAAKLHKKWKRDAIESFRNAYSDFVKMRMTRLDLEDNKIDELVRDDDMEILPRLPSEKELLYEFIEIFNHHQLFNNYNKYKEDKKSFNWFEKLFFNKGIRDNHKPKEQEFLGHELKILNVRYLDHRSFYNVNRDNGIQNRYETWRSYMGLNKEPNQIHRLLVDFIIKHRHKITSRTKNMSFLVGKFQKAIHGVYFYPIAGIALVLLFYKLACVILYITGKSEGSSDKYNIEDKILKFGKGTGFLANFWCIKHSFDKDGTIHVGTEEYVEKMKYGGDLSLEGKAWSDDPDPDPAAAPAVDVGPAAPSAAAPAPPAAGIGPAAPAVGVGPAAGPAAGPARIAKTIKSVKSKAAGIKAAASRARESAFPAAPSEDAPPSVEDSQARLHVLSSLSVSNVQRLSSGSTMGRYLHPLRLFLDSPLMSDSPKPLMQILKKLLVLVLFVIGFVFAISIYFSSATLVIDYLKSFFKKKEDENEGDDDKLDVGGGLLSDQKQISSGVLSVFFERWNKEPLITVRRIFCLIFNILIPLWDHSKCGIFLMAWHIIQYKYLKWRFDQARENYMCFDDVDHKDPYYHTVSCEAHSKGDMKGGATDKFKVRGFWSTLLAGIKDLFLKSDDDDETHISFRKAFWYNVRKIIMYLFMGLAMIIVIILIILNVTLIAPLKGIVIFMYVFLYSDNDDVGKGWFGKFLRFLVIALIIGLCTWLLIRVNKYNNVERSRTGDHNDKDVKLWENYLISNYPEQKTHIDRHRFAALFTWFKHYGQNKKDDSGATILGPFMWLFFVVAFYSLMFFIKAVNRLPYIGWPSEEEPSKVFGSDNLKKGKWYFKRYIFYFGIIVIFLLVLSIWAMEYYGVYMRMKSDIEDKMDKERKEFLKDNPEASFIPS